jgi:hypothetical protein
MNGPWGNTPTAQQGDILAEVDAYNRRRQLEEEMQRDLMDVELRRKHREWLEYSKYYRDAYQQLLQLNPDSFSITRAVFIVENAFLENKYAFKELQDRLQQEAAYIRLRMKADKMDTANNAALHYYIQKRFHTGIQYKDTRSQALTTINPFRYDFEDYLGKKDHRQLFVTKLLLSGKGQCHSIPLAYLMLAEQLGAQAWLSLAPQHSFIRFRDARGRLLNYETSSGKLVSNYWLQQSGFITTTALKNKIYLDTLSARQLYAQCLADLLGGYIWKFSYDDFAASIHARIIELDPHNMAALITDANLKVFLFREEVLAVGKPPVSELPRFPDAYKAYQDMHEAIARVESMGHQDMPAEAYQKWLKSIEQEKTRQQSRELQERLRREVEYMKKIKPRINIKNTVQ